MTSDSLTRKSSGSGSSVLPVLLPGLLLVLVGVAGATLIRGLDHARPSQPEQVMQLAALAAMAGVILPVGIYLGSRRRAAVPDRAGLIVLAGVGTALVAFYLAWVSYYVEYPADILMFAEGDFVNEIVKFRTGRTLYTAQQNNESMTYTPGAPLCTYALSRAFGAPDSIPAYRLIQLIYSLGAAVAGVFCYVRVMQLSGTRRFAEDRGLWGAIALPVFFLIANNSISNPFAHNLHNDSLAQFTAVVAYWLLLEYALTRRRLPLALMVLIPALGFLVKQSLAIWAPLYCVYVLFFDSPRSVLRSAAFAVATFASLGAVIGGCYFLWGEPFRYWAFVVMGSYHVPLLRSVQHGLVVWAYYGAGFLAALVLLRGQAAKRLLGPWVIWLLFFGAETYTSGLNVTVNHMGPGSLIAGTWFLAAVTRLWPAHHRMSGIPRRSLLAWARSGLAVGLLGLVYAGLGIVWMPVNPLPPDAYRYVEEIEREFAGLPADQVLLDLGGGWLPSRKGVVARDSAPCVGCRSEAPVGVGDFSGFLGRLEHHDYQKILVRNLDKPSFWYDGHRSPQPTGIRKAIRDNYREVGRIKSVQGEKRFMLVSYEHLPWPGLRYGFEEITLLVPKTAAIPDRVGVR
jgi:hypothetical protein